MVIANSYHGDRGGIAVDEYTMTPQPDAVVVWGKIVLQVRQDNGMPTRQSYFDEDGKLLRELIFSDYKTMDGRLIPTRLLMRPTDKPAAETTIVYDAIVFDSSYHRRNLCRQQSAAMSIRLLQLAWRNLWRNYRRTFITMTAIGVGYAMLMFVASLMAGLRWQMIENGTHLLLSQIQVHDPGYYPNRPMQNTLGGNNGTDVSALLSAITSDPRVRAAAPRVYGYGMVSSADRSSGVELLGIDPDREPEVTALQNQMLRGTYLIERTPKTVAIGDSFASTIHVEVGGEVVLLTQAADGSMGNDLYKVGGIFRTGLDGMDRSLIVMPISSLQDILQLPPGRIHEVGLKLYDIDGANVVASRPRNDAWARLLPVRVMPWRYWRRNLGRTMFSSIAVSQMFFFSFFSYWPSSA